MIFPVILSICCLVSSVSLSVDIRKSLKPDTALCSILLSWLTALSLSSAISLSNSLVNCLILSSNWFSFLCQLQEAIGLCQMIFLTKKEQLLFNDSLGGYHLQDKS